MAGRFDIQRLPKGLVDLFGMKGTGDSPHTLSDLVFTSTEVSDLYLLDRMTVTSGATAIPPAGIGYTTITGTFVPSGEIWLVYSISFISAVTAAATSWIMSGGVLRANGGVQLMTERQLVGAADSVNLMAYFQRPMIMLPGDALCVRCSQIVGAPGVVVTGSAYYARLLI
jgi:hypothetical protein